MELLIKPNDHDDPVFIDLVGRAISGLIQNHLPDEIFVIKIENWFDHKWLKFSGIGRVGFFEDFRLDRDTALDEFWQDRITFPPFTPNRVIEEHHLLRSESGTYYRSARGSHVHESQLAPSCKNLHKRVEDFANSAIFVWLSSNTQVNGRGSVMVYEVHDSVVETWYAGFTKKGAEWRVLRTSGVSREKVQSLLHEDVLQVLE